MIAMIGGGVGLLLLIIIIIGAIACSGGESGRRTPLGLALTGITQQCVQFPDGSAAAYYVAPPVRAQFQAVICQVNANTVSAIANAEHTPEYAVIGSSFEAQTRGAGADPERCSLFQDATATAVIIACSMPDPANGADALYIAYVQNPANFPAAPAL